MKKWLEKHKWYFIWGAWIAFYLVTIFHWAQPKGVQLCIGRFCSTQFEFIFWCVGIVCLFFAGWLFPKKIKTKIILMVVLSLITVATLYFFWSFKFMTMAFARVEGNLVSIADTWYFNLHDIKTEYTKVGILALSVPKNIGIWQGLQILFWNKITVCFAAIGAGIIFIKKVLAVDKDIKLL